MSQVGVGFENSELTTVTRGVNNDPSFSCLPTVNEGDQFLQTRTVHGNPFLQHQAQNLSCPTSQVPSSCLFAASASATGPSRSPPSGMLAPPGFESLSNRHSQEGAYTRLFRGGATGLGGLGSASQLQEGQNMTGFASAGRSCPPHVPIVVSNSASSGSFGVAPSAMGNQSWWLPSEHVEAVAAHAEATLEIL
eukprot:4258093-Amphidinium_carterae.2